MAEMAAAAPAMHLGAGTEPGLVGRSRDRVGQRLEEAWPAGAAVELGSGIIERQAAAGAGEDALAMLVVERAGKGRLGMRLAQHGELRLGQQLAPLRLGLLDLESAGRHRR